MSIETIKIENYKSIKKCYLNLKQFNMLIGENGCGKTNVISAIHYFYDNLIGKREEEDIFDKNNKFSNRIKIEITYDCKEIKKIISNQLKNAHGQYEEYYKKIMNLIDSEQKIKLQLSKIKDEPIKWNIKERTAREIIYNIFPIYFVDAKEINATSWNHLWEEIGDLVKLERPVSEQFQQNLLTMLENDNDNKIKNKFKELEKILEESQIEIKEYTPKQYAATIAQNYFRGEKFQIAEHSPSYFSSGTNSYNYINVLIAVISALRSKKIKLPILIIDEPEISLHHKYIDKLSENMIENESKVQFIIATHSPRLVKNILKEEETEKQIINLKCENHYTIFSEMKLFEEERQRNFINDEHANCYFSNMLILVEGESELEFLNNEYLRMLYPILRSTDIIQASANDVILSSLLPNKRNYKSPYLIWIDMDKILEIDAQQNQIKYVKKGFTPCRKEEMYYYGEKRENTYKLKKRIDKMVEKCKFHYVLPFFSCEDKNYSQLIQNIKKYYTQYHIFVNHTTIEGMLVNQQNYEIFWDFFQILKSQKDIEELKDYYEHSSENDRVNLLRLLVSGKTDYFMNTKDLIRIGMSKPEILEMIQKYKIGQKTSGWISQWFEYYLMTKLQINPAEEDANRKLKKKLKEEEQIQTIKMNFYYEFNELYQFVKEIIAQTSH